MKTSYIGPRTSRGQGLTEYTLCIAFIAVLIALVFGMGHGHLANGLSQTCSNCSGQLNDLAARSHNQNH